MTVSETRTPATVGGHQIASLIGIGGQSEVYALADVAGKPALALKWSRSSHDPPWTDPLADEYRILCSLYHPQLTRPHDFGFHDNRAFMVVDRVDGPTLFEGLETSSGNTLWQLMSAICPVLSFLHRRGIIHRDLKPANFRWSVGEGGDSTLYVLDLGLASCPRDPAAEGRAGTLYYMAPEVLKEGRVDARSDLYSLGVILFEWLTGAPPFSGDDPAEIINGHLSAPVTWPSDTHTEIDKNTRQLVERLLAKDPEHRPAGVEELMGIVTDDGLGGEDIGWEKRNVHWHRQTTFRNHFQAGCPIGYLPAAGQTARILLSGDPGAGVTETLSLWKREFQVHGWSVTGDSYSMHALPSNGRGGHVSAAISLDQAISDDEDDIHYFSHQLTLRPMSQDQVEHYLNMVFFDPHFVQQIVSDAYRLSSGLPQALDAILDEWISSGVVDFCDGAWTTEPARLAETATSTKLRSIYSGCIGGLTTAQNRCLDYAAVCGPEFSTQAVKRLLEEDHFPPDEIDTLFAHGLFLESAAPDEPMITGRFRLPGLAAVWAADLPPDYRTILHAKIASTIRGWRDRWGPRLSRRLAHHFYESGQYRKACEAAVEWAAKNATAEEAEEAHRYLKLAVQAAEHVEPGRKRDELDARIAFLRGRVYKASGVFEDARVFYLSALTITRESGDVRLHAEAAKDLGDLYKSTRRHAKGLRILKIALHNFQRLEDEAEISRTLNNLGNITWINRDVDAALEYYHRALEIQRTLDLKAEMASTLSNIGTVYIQKYELERGLEYMRESLALKEFLDQPVEVARTLNNLGAVSLVSGQYGMAEEYLARATEINRAVGARDDWLLNQVNVLETKLHLADYLGVIRETPAILRQSEELNESILRTHTYVFLARAYHAIADYRRSGHCLNSAKDLLDKSADLSILNPYRLLRCERDLLFGNRENCRMLLQQALELANQTEDPRERAEVFLAAAKIQKISGDLAPELFAAAEEAYRLFDLSAGRHRIYELLLATDEPGLPVFLQEFPLPDDTAEGPIIEYTGPPALEGLWLWRLAQKFIGEDQIARAENHLAALVQWSDEHGTGELSWRARMELGIIYQRKLDWELAARSFGGAVQQLQTISATIESPEEQQVYLSGTDVKKLNTHVTQFSSQFTR